MTRIAPSLAAMSGLARDDGTRRIRAMVAACEGISTEALEQGAIGKVVKALEALRHQAFQSDLNHPSNQWGREAIEGATAALTAIKGEQA